MNYLTVLIANRYKIISINVILINFSQMIYNNAGIKLGFVSIFDNGSEVSICVSVQLKNFRHWHTNLDSCIIIAACVVALWLTYMLFNIFLKHPLRHPSNSGKFCRETVYQI